MMGPRVQRGRAGGCGDALGRGEGGGGGGDRDFDGGQRNEWRRRGFGNLVIVEEEGPLKGPPGAERGGERERGRGFVEVSEVEGAGGSGASGHCRFGQGLH